MRQRNVSERKPFTSRLKPHEGVNVDVIRRNSHSDDDFAASLLNLLFDSMKIAFYDFNLSFVAPSVNGNRKENANCRRRKTRELNKSLHFN